VALDAIDRCHALGYSRFNVAIGESQHLLLGQAGECWCGPHDMRTWLLEQPESVNSGDIYVLA
jgi:hypothetical protein